MWHRRYSFWILASWLALVALMPAEVMANGGSGLSRWLSQQLVPELDELLSNHPRFAGQRLRLVRSQADGLSESIITVLGGNIVHIQSVSLTARSISPALPLSHVSIDDLDCRAVPEEDYLLQVDVSGRGSGRGLVRVDLVAADEPLQPIRSWQWVGRFSADERAYLERPSSPDGSIAAPWHEADVASAAQSLARDFACALRPGVVTRASLNWPAPSDLPALFADTFNASRHQLGNLSEVAVVAKPADYDIAVSVEPFREDLWQLWLTGTPRQSGLSPVQAVTYIRAQDLGGAVTRASTVDDDLAGMSPNERMGTVEAATRRPVDPAVLGKAMDFIDVEVVDALQSDRRGSLADLQVTLRVVNRGDWPIHYSFTLSGGHFRHCIASPSNYRHDQYGTVSGSLAPGDSAVQRLLIENARHQPSPLFGTPKCAGFRDLDGFEHFASKGYKVTDYVRWDL